MNRCKTCSHWEPYKPDDYCVLRGAGICLAARQIWDVTESDHEQENEPLLLLPEHAGVLAMVEDGSSYSARLVTMGDFGCLMHAPREPISPSPADTDSAQVEAEIRRWFDEHPSYVFHADDGLTTLDGQFDLADLARLLALRA